MKRSKRRILKDLSIILTLLLAASCKMQNNGASEKNVIDQSPNIIMIVADDLGWYDLSGYGNEFIETPNLDQLAKEGIRFTDAYAAAPLCSPSRASLITGLHPIRVNITEHIHGNRPPGSDQKLKTPSIAQQLSLQYKTIAEALKTKDYNTAFIGKWHLGGGKFTPDHRGFDINIAGHAAGAPESYLGTENFGNGKKGKEIWAVPGLKEYHGKDIFLTEAITQEALKSLDSVAGTQQPFFLYMSHYAVHTPIMGDERFVQKYLEKGLDSTEARYASMVEGIDKSLGDVMKYLDEKEISENTVVLFMSDNGGLSAHARGGEPHTHNMPLSSGKGSMREGGIREPMLVKWPEKIEPNSTSSYQVIIEDFYPSILEMAGIDSLNTVQRVDGQSFVSVLKGEKEYEGVRPLVWHYPNEWGPSGPGIGAASAIRKGDFKLIYYHASQEMELFNLKEDIGETKNLVKVDTLKTKELAQNLSDYLKDVDAQMPILKATDEKVPYPVNVLSKEIQ